MLFDIKLIEDRDYENILVNWWSDWGWTPPNKDFLPDNGKGGIIIYDKKTPVCAGFIYTTNSSVAWIDWIISNKKYRKKPHRKKALNLLIDTLNDVAKKTECKYIYAHNNNIHLINTFISNGYLKGSKSTELIKKL